MRKNLALIFCSISFLIVPFFSSNAQVGAKVGGGTVKEWTLLVYLNGNNNLDSYGDLNINQMEKIGSTDGINLVVQWASLRKGKTQRLYVKKDNNPSKVTSPVVQDMGDVDMGDWRSLVEFVQWGVANYPAKRYFIDVWDHGSGWHAMRAKKNGEPFNITDISWDDNTGNSITTKQLGQALAESAKIIGHKVDLYGSDACLMGMAEVANEMSDSVSIFAGSQEVEPGAGWPYDTFVKAWAADPTIDASKVASILTDEYIKSYSGGSNGNQEVTFSAYDLDQMANLNEAMTALGSDLQKLGSAERTKVLRAAKDTQNFTYGDYGDLIDFLAQIETKNISSLKSVVKGAKSAAEKFVIKNGTTSEYARAKGVSIWLPTTSSTYDSYADKYATLQFQSHTDWSSALRSLIH